ncbi:MAG: helix-turn-helix transcriptional regulator [Alphaproteobacteria bacterium]|nr:helix-turn-helix transcriptional regulator [Alphaproteobacteria bacterium]
MKRIDETAGRIGAAMRHARNVCHLHQDDMAILLRITPAELYAYERGTLKISQDVLERIVLMGFKMIHVHRLERLYRWRRGLFEKLNNN